MNSLQIRWRHLLALSLILLCSVSALFARPLSEREARHLAEQFFHQVAYAHKVLAPAQQPLSLVSAPIRQSAGVELRTLSGDKARYYYIYNRGSNAGFVIIAGDDELTPYIGYATTGQVLEQDMPEQLRAFLKACQERIDELTSSVGLRSSLRPTPRTATEPAQIAPLLGNIQWNQSAPWNNQTPTDNQGEHMPVGCVATAYTQVMRYHQWPTQGEGSFSYTEEGDSGRSHTVDFASTTYDWAHMPERYNDPSSATSEETQALSTLAYHAGVAVEMMYSPSGSGSYTPLVARALADHFRYDKRVSFRSRSNYTQSSWEQMLRAELIAARPVVYSGTGSGGGHAFVCDGYDMEGLFHINWGWGGMSDGYFNLNYLVPSDLGIGGGAGGGFSLGQGAVVGIKPDKTGSSQRQESSLVTTWRFGMTFTEGTLDASAEYTVGLTTDATPYDGSVTYGVTKVGTTDTLYLDQYARNAHIDGLYQGFSIDPEKLQLSNHIGVGTWDIFLAYRHTDATGQTAWRPCGQHERAKEQYRHTYTITQESDGSYVVTEEASSNLSMLELVAGSVQSYTIVGYEKSKVSLQLRNTGRVEFFDQLYLYARKVGERIFEPVVNILPAIGAGEVKEVTFEIDRFPYGSGDVELEVGYFIGNRFNQLSTTTVSIQSATDIRTAYVLSSDQPVTVNVTSGNLSQIRIRNIGTKTPTNRVFYRWELRKEKQTASTRWTQIDIPAGGEQLVAPNLASELSQIGAKRGDNITLTATFVEVSDEGRIISVIPLMEEPKLSVYCDGELVVGDGVITMTTARTVGKEISFTYWAEGDVVIEGATGTPKEKERVDYTLTSQQVSLRGDITALICLVNELTNLDVSQCSSLEYLSCFLNQIKGEAMTQLVNSLPDRTGKEAGIFAVYSLFQEESNICLKSDVAIAKAKNWQVALATVENGEVKLYLYEGEDDSQPSVGDGVITMTTAKAVGETVMLKMIYTGDAPTLSGLTGTPESGKTIIYTLTSQTVTITGDVTYFDCGNNQLTALDVSKNTALTELYCNDSQLTALDVSQNTALTRLSCYNNQLTELDVSQNTALTGLSCYDNLLTALDVSKNTALIWLNCERNQLTALDVSQNTALTGLDCSDNLLTALDVSQNIALSGLYCSNNQLTALDVSQNTALENLYCYNNQLTALDVSQNTALTDLVCERNQLTALDVSKNTALIWLDCPNNQLTALDVSQNTALEILSCYGNQIKGEEMTRLVNSLPDRTGKKAGRFTVVQEPDLEGNICLKSDVAIAKGKNWNTLKYESDTQNSVPYEGAEDAQPLKVTLTKEGEGTLTAMGADDLNAVPYGTELTVEAAPAEGYELTALTANGKDILATKMLSVREDTEIKATFTKVGDGVITMTTAKSVGESIRLGYLADGGVSIEGAEGTPRPNYYVDYTLTNQQVTMRGDITVLSCYDNRLTDIDVSQCSSLRTLVCHTNEIKGKSMLQLVNSLPDRTGLESGEFVVYSDGSFGPEGNVCLKSDVAIARAKNWEVYLQIVENGVQKQYRYDGEDPTKTFAVTFAKEGEGTLTATGADDLNAVPYGTKLTVEAAPAEGYELTALTANGKDILSSKKFTVKETVEVKATFTKKTFTVTFTQEGEGKLTATGADNLNSVAYGTELTIVATPAEGYELTALTANGEDILATKKFVVKGATDVKATFTKKTFAVTFAKEGEGTITATGADDLNAVAYGTELTIVATPAEGYELTALTANGEDILATKKFVVKGATEVKAIFEKKTFAVTLTSNEHGTISIVENVDLKAVPYGTTLTVQATGKNDQCELTALTANGEDILATKKFVVKGATEVKATFVDHTGVETTVTQQVKLYPNPATDYVIVEGIAPASEVMLHSMTGELMCAMQADAEGHLQIDLTALSDGVYLLVGTGWQERLVVKK